MVLDFVARNAEWEKRVKMFGKKAVFNICHKTEEEFTKITLVQQETIMPLFRKMLKGDEQFVLDFGCGWGRWTGILADEIRGKAVGVDPTRFFLDEAEKTRENASVLGEVEYRLYQDGMIPLCDSSMDVVWACLVLSTVLDEEMLASTIREIDRVLKPGGLMFLIDNTAGPANRPVVRSRWSMSRTIEEYQDAFKKVAPLVRLGEYIDLGEVNTIMAGRKG
jgi:ubiquinone/menaquinone biosynthesis C-methylase UbiE